MAPGPPPIRFPPVASADDGGLLAITPTLSRELLLSAYRQGVFPWTDGPVGWFAPPARGVLLPERAHFPRNFARLMRRAAFTVRFDYAFDEVIAACRAAHAEQGEWLTEHFVAAYVDLWRCGHGHSVEILRDDVLVGGLYGVQVGSMFCAESMFGVVDNASKAAVYALLAARAELGVSVVDVQVVGETTARLGAVALPREAFMRLLGACSASYAERAGVRWPHAPRALCDYLAVTLTQPQPAARAPSPTRRS